MNFRQLLLHRDALLRQARLANLAFACDRLTAFAERLERARIAGPLTLHPADPAADRFVPALIAHASSQAVVDEHFLDEDIVELADVLGFLSAEGFDLEFTFDVEVLWQEVLPLVEQELQRVGVEPETARREDSPNAGLGE